MIKPLNWQKQQQQQHIAKSRMNGQVRRAAAG
jgi:hypothetical protein